MQHDVFICHASEDKDALVRPLATALEAEHIDVWYDEFSLRVGDSIRQSIDRGLAGARFGVVVLSPSFFGKRWTQWELNGLVSRTMQEGRGIILPIWHEVGQEDVVKYSPPLADIRALKSGSGVVSLCNDLLDRLRPELVRCSWPSKNSLVFGGIHPRIPTSGGLTSSSSNRFATGPYRILGLSDVPLPTGPQGGPGGRDCRRSIASTALRD